jgi:hypothetical protein
MKIEIGEEVYSVVPNTFGCEVRSLAGAKDYNERCYQVFVEEGEVRRCSCPDHTYRKRVCKHMGCVAHNKKVIFG